MGTWGIEPDENDAAGDWEDAIRDRILEALRFVADPKQSAAMAATGYAEARRAADLMVHLARWKQLYFDSVGLGVAVTALDRILADTRWTAQWRDCQSELVASIRAQRIEAVLLREKSLANERAREFFFLRATVIRKRSAPRRRSSKWEKLRRRT